MTYRFEMFTTAIAEINRCIQKIKAMEMTEFNLRGGHLMCLYYLLHHPEWLTVSEISVLCDEDKAAVSRFMADLQERRFAFCQASGARKKYRAKLFLTEPGKEIAHSVDQRVERAVNRGGDGLTETQRVSFYDALLRITHNLKRYYDEKREEC